MITIVDHGCGNLKSVYNAIRYVGGEVSISQDPSELDVAEKIILPGVGSSKDAMEGLRRGGFPEAIKRNIFRGKPFLGICLGLQLLFEWSEESGGCECLGIVPGNVRLFHRDKGRKVPQIGWNTVELSGKECPIFKGINNLTYFYFVHSYYCVTDKKDNVAGITSYGVDYVSAFWKDNLFAVQFHPERSQENGLKILENFSKL